MRNLISISETFIAFVICRFCSVQICLILNVFVLMCSFRVSQEIDSMAKKKNSTEYKIAQRRLFDMRFKSPTRFRRIICDFYEKE